MGKNVNYKTCPFFWSRFFDKSFAFVGFKTKYDEIVYKGDVDSGKFMAVYCGERVCNGVSGAGMGHNMILMM